MQENEEEENVKSESVYAKRKAAQKAKLEQAKKKLDEMAVSGEFEVNQSVSWTSDFVLNYKTMSTGTQYCPLKGCGIPSKKRLADHLLESHGLTGSHNEQFRISLSMLGDAIADRQRSFILDCQNIPHTLLMTEAQLSVWHWVLTKMEENCIPVLNKNALSIVEDKRLERLEAKIDFLVAAERKRSTAPQAPLINVSSERNQPAVTRDAGEGTQPNEGEADEFVAEVQPVSNGPAEAEVVEEPMREDMDDDNERIEQFEAMFDLSLDEDFPDYWTSKYRVKKSERGISQRIGFWRKLKIENHPFLMKYVEHVKNLSQNRSAGLEIAAGVEFYPAYVARYLLYCKRAFKRLGLDVTRDDFIASCSLTNHWFQRIQREKIGPSVVKAFCNALASFANFILDKVNQDDRFRRSCLERIQQDLREWRNRAEAAIRYRTGMKGSVSQKKKTKSYTRYDLLCAAFRSEKVQSRFQRIRESFNAGEPLLKEDYNYILTGCVYSLAVFNGARPEAIYKLRVGGIEGDLDSNGDPDPETGFQKIQIGEQTLWASPYPVPKQYVSKRVFVEELRGTVIFEKTTREWFELLSAMRSMIQRPQGVPSSAKSQFFVNFNGVPIKPNGVLPVMRRFLALNDFSTYVVGCNPIRHTVADEMLRRIVLKIYDELVKSGVPALQQHNPLTQLSKYTSNLYEAVALGYLQLRKLENELGSRNENVGSENPDRNGDRGTEVAGLNEQPEVDEMESEDDEDNDMAQSDYEERNFLDDDDDGLGENYLDRWFFGNEPEEALLEAGEDANSSEQQQRHMDIDSPLEEEPQVEDPLTYPPLQYPRDGGFGSDESLDGLYGPTRTVGEGSENITMEYDDSEDDADVRAENQKLPQVNMARDLGRDEEMTSERYLEILREHNENPAEKPLLGWNDSSKDFLARSNAHPIQKWSWLRIADAGVAGLGVFAKCDLPKDATICDYRGIMMEVEAHEERMKEAEDGESVAEEFHFRNNYYMEGSVVSKGMRRKFGIESQFPVCDGRVMIGRLINHSKEHPNVEVVAHHKVVAGESKIQIVFVTKRKIKANEEILFDYGTSFSHLSECFCYKCKERSLDAMPKLPESFTMPKPQPSTMLSMSQSDVAEPLRKRVAGYHVRRLIDVFDNNGQLTWSDALPDWPTALSFGIGIFDSKMSVPHGRTAEEHIAHCHEEATRHQELVLVLMKNLELTFVLGKADGSPGALLQIDSSGVRYAVPKRGRRDQLVQQDLNDMRIVHLNEKTFNEHIDVIRRIPV